MTYLISVDMEGVHGVVGEPYKGLLTEIPDYKKACKNGAKEVNAVVKALCDTGADKIYVWDNHGNLDNLNFDEIDKRAQKIIPENNGKKRLDFLTRDNFVANILIGYHCKEGTVNGILAHTYDSSAMQYYKINGKQVGEAEVDAYIASEYGVPTIFVASDDVCTEQLKEFDPRLITAVTKIGKGRNSAEFIQEEKVLEDIYWGVKTAVDKNAGMSPKKLQFPCEIEIRYTRTEFALERLNEIKERISDVRYGEDAHVLKMSIKDVDQLRFVL